MQVIGFVGSPRENGNTAVLVQRILDGAASTGAHTEIIFLNKLNIRGCQACMYCKSHDGCKQEDDMIPLIEKIKKADRLVFGSPIYIGYVTGQAKIFLDRLYVFFRGPNAPGTLPAGKKAALVFSQGNPDENAFKKYIEMIPGFLGRQMEITDTLFAAGVPKAADDESLMQRALQIGLDLVK